MSVFEPDSQPSNVPASGRWLRNLLVALAAVVLSTGLFFGVRLQNSSVSLGALAAAAVPLEQAQANDRPSLVEFYADWCTSCRAMAPMMANLRQRYGEQVNFVMLNVDNTKWLPEVSHYQIDGIPHFLFLSAQNQLLASAIGEQPRSVMDQNLQALSLSQPELLGAQRPVGQTSALQFPKLRTPEAAAAQLQIDQTSPKAHGPSL